MRITGDISSVDMATGRERAEIPVYIGYLDMTAFGFEFGDRTCIFRVPSIDSNAPCADIATLGYELRGAADVLRFDVARFSFHFDVVATRHHDFKLDPELRAVRRGFRKLRRERAGDFDTVRDRSRSEPVAIEQMLSQRAARV